MHATWRYVDAKWLSQRFFVTAATENSELHFLSHFDVGHGLASLPCSQQLSESSDSLLNLLV